MNNFIVVNDSCEYCSREYIARESDKLKDMSLNQARTHETHRIIHAAYRNSCKPCVRILCHETFEANQVVYHNVCAEHLYKMIDAIKEYEEDAKEEQ